MMIHTPTERSAPPARMGDTAQTFVGTGAQVAGTTLATVGALAAPSVGLITLGSTLAAAIPVAGAVLAVGVLIFSLLHNSRGLQQDAETTAQVNAAAKFMQQNLDAWNASNKSLSTQAQALKNFDDAWQAIVNFCSRASEGSPGQRCISERQRGGKYDFFSYYRDPIANDPAAGAIDRQLAAVADPVATLTSIDSGSPASLTRFAIPAGLLALAFLVDSK
jgi:hypothetical protein